jgi:hypothetical protein
MKDEEIDGENNIWHEAPEEPMNEIQFLAWIGTKVLPLLDNLITGFMIYYLSNNWKHGLDAEHFASSGVIILSGAFWLAVRKLIKRWIQRNKRYY